MTFRSTEGNGGPPIITSREPVEKPVIPRGRTFVPKCLFYAVPFVGERLTFHWPRDDADLTFHDVPIVDETLTDLVVDVSPETVVTWDRVATSDR